MGASALDVAGARLWPLSQAIGARPTIMAACLADNGPISLRPAMSAIAVTVPMPGMEVRMASRLARRGSASIRRSISASQVFDRRFDGAQLALDLAAAAPSCCSLRFG